MKKIGALLIGLLLVVAGSAYFLLRTPVQTTDTGYAEYLPSETVLTLSLRDLSGLADLFPKTALGHFLSKETMGAILENLQAEPEIIRNYETGYDELFSVLNNPAFRMVFGDDVDLALLPVDKQQISDNPQQAVERALVVLATTSSSKALETFARTLLHKDVSEYRHGELLLTRIRLDTGAFVYALTKSGRLLLALDPAVIEQCVAAYGSENTLRTNQNFVDAISFWKKTPLSKVYSRGFVQIDRIRPYLDASADKDLRDGGRYLQGMKYIASVGGQKSDGWGIDYSGSYTYDALDPTIRELIAEASATNPTLHLLQGNPLLYSWSSSLGASALLEALSASDSKSYRKVDDALQREFGVSLDKAVHTFGPQYGGVLKKIVQNGLFPIPKVVLFVQVKDSSVAKTLLDRVRQKVAQRGMLTEHQEQAGPYVIYSWSLLPGEDTQPAVLLTDDMLYLANGPASLKQILSDGENPGPLSKQLAGKLGAGESDRIQAANNGVVMVWPARMAAQVQGIADWLVDVFSSSQRGSIEVLTTEVLRLLQSGELTIFVSDLFKDRAEASVIIKSKSADKSVAE